MSNVILQGFSPASKDSSIPIFLLLFPLRSVVPFACAQSADTNNAGQYQDNSFTPSLVVIIVVLFAALFLLGLFSIYIRRWANDAAGGSIRRTLSVGTRRGAAATRGLDAAVIATFPTFAYSAVKGLKIGKGALECAVCLNEFEDDETLRLIPKCDHVFHPECIDAWLESRVTCPVCRANLVPQPGESTRLPLELDLHQPTHPELGVGQQNVDVSVSINDDSQQQREVSNRSRSVKLDNAAAASFLAKFRSHSTGHSLVKPPEGNLERYTLSLPEEVRKQLMNQALLNHAGNSSACFPKEGSSKKGYRTGEGSSRGRNIRGLEGLDRNVAQSERWVFPRTSSFLTRAFPARSPRVAADDAAPGNNSSASDAVDLNLAPV